MFSTTELYKQKMREPYRQALEAEVEYGQVDPDARDNAKISELSPAVYFSIPSQTLNNWDWKPSVKIASLEDDGFPLDGTYTLAPEAPPTYEVGYWSEELGDAEGRLSVVYEVSTTQINAVGISILFEPLLIEWAVDFDVSFGGKRYEIRGNNKTLWVSDFPVEGCTSVRVEIKKWSRPNARVKIQQFEFGVYIVYTASEMTELTIDNRIDPVSSSLPESAVSFGFVNFNKEYDPLVRGGREKFIEERQPVSVRMGYPGEMYKVGYYELTGAPSISAGCVTLNATSLIRKLDKSKPAAFYQNTPLDTILREILLYCGITDFRIDESLKGIAVTALTDEDCRALVTDIAIASCCTVWFDFDVFVMGKLPTKHSGYIIDGTMTEAPEIEVRPPVEKLNVEAASFQVAGTESDVGYLKAAAAGTYKISIEPCLSPRATAGNVVKSGVDFMEITTIGAAEITVKGRKITKTVMPYDISKSGRGDELRIEGNPFINTRERAQAVANWLFSYYSRRQELTARWRQDPAVQAGDIVLLDTDFGRQAVQIEQQYFEWPDGGLMGKTKAVMV